MPYSNDDMRLERTTCSSSHDLLGLASISKREYNIEESEYYWKIYLDSGKANEYKIHSNKTVTEKKEENGFLRQQDLYRKAGVTLDSDDIVCPSMYTYESDYFVKNCLTRTRQSAKYCKDYFSESSSSVHFSSPSDRARRLTQIIDKELFPSKNTILYRGVNYSAQHIINRSTNEGDILINCDFLSFSENPFIVGGFCSGLDDTSKGSVVYVLNSHHSAKALAPFSMRNSYHETESIYSPLHFFRVKSIKQIFPVVDDIKHNLHLVLIEELPEVQSLQIEKAMPSILYFGDRYLDFATGKTFDYYRFKCLLPWWKDRR
ncbi:MAG: hypothetical protein GY750_15795 [Lentisphaerae bacterium]|nr:hypothetical protein [Lentisphaerota bacterium]MCP4102861.1 hypothetical protein [Lentisphaerota bacterium]